MTTPRAFFATTARWAVVPVSLLLFLQWPLRDLLHAGSREANDTAQWLFALYVAIAVTQATRADAHVRMVGWFRAPRWLGPLCILPWAGFILVSAAPAVWRSVMQWEAFPDTVNPGYWIVKLAAWLLALFAAGQALATLARRR